MIFTFEELRKRTRTTIRKKDGWELVENQSDTILAYYSRGNIHVQFTPCEFLTKEMERFVYRQTNSREKTVIKDSFIAIYDQEEKAISMEITVENRGDHCHSQVIARYIKEGWTFDYQTEVSWTDKMEQFKNKLLQVIQDLPEFRLLEVTGMWEEKNESKL